MKIRSGLVAPLTQSSPPASGGRGKNNWSLVKRNALDESVLRM